MEPLQLTVRQLNMYVKSLLEGNTHLSCITLVGELFDFKNHYSSGHLYFSLKDTNALVQCVMFKANALRVNFVPENGMKVVCRGYVSLYERDGRFQFYAESMTPFGKGDLAEQFERTKAKLEGEGLFDASHKRPLPEYALTIGVVTSDTGAALQDVLNIAARRFPLCKIVIFPALVQGISAPESLIKALDAAYNRKDIELIIIGRGGGSADDLSSFNDEKLARKLFCSPVPVISAVGHETDFTICDYVCDMRAPTPSAAAELAVPSAYEILNRINVLKQKGSSSIIRKISDYSARLERIKASRMFIRPEMIFDSFEIRLDSAVIKLELQYKSIIKTAEMRLARQTAELQALGVHNTLNRGFALAMQNNEILRSASRADLSQPVTVKLSSGSLICNISDTED